MLRHHTLYVQRQFNKATSIYDLFYFHLERSKLSDLGLYPASDTVHVDMTSSPSHCLFTTQSPAFTLLNHNATLKWSVLNNVIWEYILASKILTNIKESEDNYVFSLYPNPANSQLNVRSKGNALGKTYYLGSTTGQLVGSGQVSSS